MSMIARLSLAQYDRMIEHGVFDQGTRQRLEFVRGEIREMAPIGSRHEEVVDRLTSWSARVLPEAKIRLRVQNSVGLPELESAPEPDIAWVVQRDYSQARPTSADVLLIVEVAGSSLAYDIGEKADLYAAAGISDYWVVDLDNGWIEVRRDPAAGRYRTLHTYSSNDEISPLALPEAVLRPASLFASPE
jgi:Uma2 family endonuclease